ASCPEPGAGDNCVRILVLRDQAGARKAGDRRDPGAGAPLGGAGGHRGHQGRPRRRVPGGQGRLSLLMALIETAPPPTTGAWREGDPPGRRRWVRLAEPLPLEFGGELPAVSIAYETWG